MPNITKTCTTECTRVGCCVFVVGDIVIVTDSRAPCYWCLSIVFFMWIRFSVDVQTTKRTIQYYYFFLSKTLFICSPSVHITANAFQRTDSRSYFTLKTSSSSFIDSFWRSGQRWVLIKRDYRRSTNLKSIITIISSTLIVQPRSYQ